MATIKWARAASYNKANTYPGANGEIVIDMEQNRLFLYDGANAYVSNTFFSANVYIAASFSWSNTPTESILRASDAQTNDLFGYDRIRLNSDGAYAIIGVSAEDGGSGDPLISSGAAYIFTRSGSTWTQQTKLTASDAGTSDTFGFSVDISDDGDYAIIGATGDDDEGSAAGAAYIFTRSGSTWTQQAKITASDGSAGDNFGQAVSISGDGTYAVVGAHQDNGVADAVNDAGAAYIFTRSGSTWTQQAKISPNIAEHQFGYYVAMNRDGTYVAINAPEYNSFTGRTFVYSRSGSTWTSQGTLDPSDVASGDRVSYVDINADGDYVVQGVWRDDDDGDGSGSAYIFTRSGSTWTQQAKLTASDAQASDNFGKCSINDDGDLVIIGSYSEDGGPGNPITGAGAAYIFARDGTTWTEVRKLTASDAQTEDKFGFEVAISGDGAYAAAGAPYEDGGPSDPISNAGAVYIFDAT